MGLFSRLKRVISANLNQLISKSEDPEKMLNTLITEMNQQLIESKRSVAGAIADEKKLERQMQEMLNQAKEWERKAILAVRAAEKEPDRAAHFEGLAKQALLQKKQCESDAEKYKEQWEAQHESVAKLKDALRGLQQRIEEAQRKKNLLLARSRRAEAQKRIQDQLSGISQSSAFEAFDRMEARVDQIEAEADALKELDGPSNTSLEQQFAALEAGSGGSADEMLENLKSRLYIEDTSGASGKKASSGQSAPKAEDVDTAEVDQMMEDLKRKMNE
ncbi:PspA/IM30 family protein [Spirochaeta lutea]|uniref:PspA/IM30 family protein n=1 Tax=Spirochaeta lutea TaxID=1480694 RepID=UPI00055C8C88|nr:PspA/IM30 family protein [Spirochaeta lutea]